MDKKLKACIEYIESEYKDKNKNAFEELISYHLQNFLQRHVVSHHSEKKLKNFMDT